jgi:hypothetical protein
MTDSRAFKKIDLGAVLFQNAELTPLYGGRCVE